MTPIRLRRFVCSASILIHFLSTGFAQDTIVVSFDCGQVVLGEQFCVPVRVDNFTNITTFSLLISWDPQVIDFVSIQNEAFPAGSAWNAPGPNDLRYIWGDGAGLGHDLPDGSVLLEICFEAIGVPGSTSIITSPPFVLNPFNSTEFANPDAEAIPSVAVPCTVEILDPPNVLAIIEACGSPDGIANGTFTITAAGGAGPYTYMWSGPVNGSSSLATSGSSETQSVPPGNYTITVTDMTGDSEVYMITIITDEMMPLITIIREVTCFNFSNGRIEVGAFGGTHPISVIWQNTSNPVYAGSGYLSSSGDAFLMNSLPIGNYLITLIDNRGCVKQEMVSLSANPIDITTMATDATCIGMTDGSVSITFSGGRPYSNGDYRLSSSWGGGVSVTPPPVMSPPILGPGQHWVQVCDSIPNCCVRDTFTIGALNEYSANIVTTAPSCADTDDGSAEVTGTTNGVPVGPYSFQLYDSTKMPSGAPIAGPGALFTGLAPGTYYVVVTEGMCRSDTLEILVPDTPPLDIELLSVKPSGCIAGQGSGEISVMASGGSPGYTFSWDGGARMGALITGVTSGMHFLTVTDANGCTGTLSVSVPQATGPNIDSISVSNLGCTAGDIIVELHYTEGTVGLNLIDWSTGDSTAIIMTTGPDTVNVLIRDSLFCFDIANVIIPGKNVLTLDSVFVENPTCIGDDDGQFTVFVSQGQAPYTYIWSTGDTTSFNLLPGLLAGTYSVTILDSDTCNILIDTTVVLMDPVPPDFVFSAQVATTCYDSCDGSATLIPSGGIPGEPYTFFWDSGLMETGMQSIAQDLCRGYQRVIITQDDLCFYEDSVLIDAPDPVGIDTVMLDHVSCFGLSDGVISVQGEGGTGPYSYTWDLLPAGGSHNQLSAGIYMLTITDSNGCGFEDVLEIQEPDSLVLEIDSSGLSPVSCNRANSGVITLSTNGGNGGYDYSWDPAVSTGFVAINVPAGTYQITVTDSEGCTDTTSIIMTGPAPVVGFLPMIDDPLCFGGLTPVTVDSASGGNGGYSWNVNGGQAHPIDSVVMLPPGIYSIITQDSTGCRDTMQILINNPDPLDVTVFPEDPVIDLGDSVRLQVLLQGMQGPITSVLWSGNGPLSCNDCPSPVAYNVFPTVYTVTVWDENGCSASTEVFVDVSNQREVFIPTAFSPNFDGRNDDLLLFVGQGIASIPSMRIFDRWGEAIVEETDIPPLAGGIVVWDGSFRGKMMDPGVYVYFIEVEFLNGEVLRYRGDVTLLR